MEGLTTDQVIDICEFLGLDCFHPHKEIFRDLTSPDGLTAMMEGLVRKGHHILFDTFKDTQEVECELDSNEYLYSIAPTLNLALAGAILELAGKEGI